ncbi:MAG TPA: 1-acyl-sn-glycerol-3-phosphate acyltransferase [Opitutaceae bacterium]|nr:1-acyl-sn-glycerol-3-phosphate acyltransferase [Opitutaceae bacterium]
MNLRSSIGELVRRPVRGLVQLYYPRVVVTGRELIPPTGPVLLAANHPNSLIDPVLLGIAARRPVRLMAKAPLFEIPLFGDVLRALGMVPAYRGSDDARQVTKNLESLAAAARTLAAGHAMGIFPEGKSHDAAQLALVRSGAARLALQALALGAADLVVVPVGINYERKERFRTAVWLKVGRPIHVARWLAMHEGDEHKAMRTLTAELNARLRHCVVHLDDPAWEPLLAGLEELLPPAGFRDNPLAALHRRKRAADAINHFQRADPERAAAAAARIAAHRAAVRASGLPGDARLLRLRGPALAGVLLRDALVFIVGGLFGLLGLAHHAVPYGVVRLIAGRMQGTGRMVVALNRMLFSVPVYAAWYGFVWWRMSLYFLPWVAWAWAALMPFAGLVAVHLARRARTALPFWWAELRLLFRPGHAAALRADHAALGRMLDGFAADAKLRTTVAPPASVTLRPPLWASLTAAAVLAAGCFGAGVWLLRDRPIDVLRTDAPALAGEAPPVLAERIAADERALAAVLAGLDELEARFRKFEQALLAGDRSYYRQADDDEMRRMLVTYLSFRTALLRTVWHYQRHAEVPDETLRLRALLLHYTAAAVAYDYSARFVLAFEASDEAIRKLNEPEPRWDLPPRTYDTIRANLGHIAHRRWLESGWRHYHATLPRWEAAGLRRPDPYAAFHAAILRSGENTAHLSDRLFRYKLQTALADVEKFARGGYYRASSAVSVLVGDTKIREPRGGRTLITADRLAALRPRLRPGDILIERRNWYLSNAFLPGYWPHSALYVGTAEDLRALGLDQDPRVAPHLARFAGPDAAGHPFACIEAVSEGVIFTTVEHSIGEADSVAVLRPKLPPEQVKEIIARAFSHAGKPYDFDFDFFSSDKLVCTEVVYRACDGFIDFPLSEILGRKTLPALEIVRYWTTPEGAEKLEFVGFLDGDESSGTCTERDAAALKASIDRPAITWLQ